MVFFELHRCSLGLEKLLRCVRGVCVCICVCVCVFYAANMV